MSIKTQVKQTFQILGTIALIASLFFNHNSNFDSLEIEKYAIYLFFLFLQKNFKSSDSIGYKKQ